METLVKRERTFQWDNPMQGAQKALQMSGIEYLKAMYNGEIPAPPVMHTLGMDVVQFEKGEAIFSFTPQEFHYNPIGCVHGGVVTTLLDSAMGATLHSTLEAGTGYTTLELKVNFLKTITTKTPELKAIGKIIHAGSRTALVEAQLVDERGTVYAHGISTCMILKF
jgi:uncharacterized protein (TIGR00369 family)